MNAPGTFPLVENSGKETHALLKGTYQYHFPENSISTAVSKLFESNKLPVIEFNLSAFTKWYSDLRFSQFMDEDSSHISDDNFLWHLKVILVNPHACLDENQTKNDKNTEWAKQLASSFYKKIFANNPADHKGIEKAVSTDRTVLLVSYRTNKNSKDSVPKSFVGIAPKRLTVIAAASFKEGILPEEEIRPALITWLAVSDPYINKSKTSHAPSKMNHSWRRQGFATFLLVHVIKRCCCTPKRNLFPPLSYPFPVDVYLQCTIPSAYQFYLSLGFVHINNQLPFDDGQSMLPDCIRKALQETPEAFIQNNDPSGTKCKLMHLRPGTLQQANTPDETATIEKGISSLKTIASFVWCQYPPSKRGYKARIFLTEEHLAMAHQGLTNLQNLLPPPYNRLLPSESFRFHGDVLAGNRIMHSKLNGGAWMSGSEIDMLLALLLRDGRYDESVSIIPTSYAQTIEEGYETHLRYEEAIAITQDGKTAGIDKAIVENRIQSTLKESLNNIQARYENCLDTLIRKVLIPNPGMLSKRCIVIPSCKNEHWTTTFIFNPASIEDDSLKPESLRPCFYHYCPLGGKTKKLKSSLPHSRGSRWFLNLASSYRKYQETEPPPPNGMQWHAPFGKDNGLLYGTESFPTLRIMNSKGDRLPIQKDAHNCGIGIVAAVALILRDIVGVLNGESKFHLLFQRNSLPHFHCNLTEGFYCQLPTKSLKRLPSLKDLVWGNYLKVLREEIFIMMDRLAELQHVLIPSKLGHKVSVEYYEILSQITWPTKGKDNTLMGKKRTAKSPPITLAEDEEQNQNDEAAAASSLINLSSNQSQGGNSGITTDNDPDQIPIQTAKKRRVQAKISEEESNEIFGSWKDRAKKVVVERIKAKKLHLTEDGFYVTTETLLANAKKKQQINKQTPPNDAIMVTESEDAKQTTPNDDIIDSNSEENGKEMLPRDTELTMEHLHRYASYVKELANKITKPEVAPLLAHDEMESFVQESFKKWKWSDEIQHKEDVAKYLDLARSSKTATWKEYYLELYRGIKKERKFFRKWLEAEFRATTPGMLQSVKYDKSTNSFYGNVVYKVEDPITKESQFESETLKLEEEWIRHACGKEIVEHIIRFGNEHGFVTIPTTTEPVLLPFQSDARGKLQAVRFDKATKQFFGRVNVIKSKADQAPELLEVRLEDTWIQRNLPKDVIENISKCTSDNSFVPIAATNKTIRIHSRPISSVRYYPPSTKTIQLKYGTRNVTKRITQRRPTLQPVVELFEEPLPRKRIDVSGFWMARNSDGKTMKVDEEYLRNKFGNIFVEEAKKLRRGFIDIPVGESKPSHLFRFPNLRVVDAPRVYFTQDDDQDLCVPKALASALFAIGFTNEAKAINNYGEENLSGSVVDAFQKVVKEAIRILPKWLQPKYIPKGFNWKTDLCPDSLFLGVLKAADGHSNHAIAIHGNFIYDANEVVAIPLGDAGLDYCTSTPTRQSRFISFRRGVLFSYSGSDLKKKQSMAIRKHFEL